MKRKNVCLNCGKEIKGKIHKDKLGKFKVCSCCGATSDI